MLHIVMDKVIYKLEIFINYKNGELFNNFWWYLIQNLGFVITGGLTIYVVIVIDYL